MSEQLRLEFASLTLRPRHGRRDSDRRNTRRFAPSPEPLEGRSLMSVTSPLTIQGEANSVTSSVPLVAPGGQTGVQVPETQVTGTAYAGSQLLTAASNIDNSPYTLPVVQQSDSAGAGDTATAPALDTTQVSGIAYAALQVPTADPNTDNSPYTLPVVQQSDSSGATSGSSQFPASYNLVTLGDVTPVRDQGEYGTCWAFATYGSLESSILKAGGPSTYFSVNNLINYAGFDLDPYNGGGNYYMSQAYLSRGSGPIDETDDPYPSNDQSFSGTPEYYVEDTSIFVTENEIKNALMTNGALATMMYMDANPADGYFRPSDSTYYYNGTSTTNHGVTIVGWDDAIQTAAPTPGTWLIKNSWGTGWGENGYFWLSYADTEGATPRSASTTPSRRGKSRISIITINLEM